MTFYMSTQNIFSQKENLFKAWEKKNLVITAPGRSFLHSVEAKLLWWFQLLAFPLQDTLLTLFYLGHTLRMPHEGDSVYNSRPQTTRPYQMSTLASKALISNNWKFHPDTSFWEKHIWFRFSLFYMWIFGVFLRQGLELLILLSNLPSAQRTNLNH